MGDSVGFQKKRRSWFRRQPRGTINPLTWIKPSLPDYLTILFQELDIPNEVTLSESLLVIDLTWTTKNRESLGRNWTESLKALKNYVDEFFSERWIVEDLTIIEKDLPDDVLIRLRIRDHRSLRTDPPDIAT